MQSLVDIMSVGCAFDEPHAAHNLSVLKNSCDTRLVTLPEILRALDVVTSYLFSE